PKVVQKILMIQNSSVTSGTFASVLSLFMRRLGSFRKGERAPISFNQRRKLLTSLFRIPDADEIRAAILELDQRSRTPETDISVHEAPFHRKKNSGRGQDRKSV